MFTHLGCDTCLKGKGLFVNYGMVPTFGTAYCTLDITFWVAALVHMYSVIVICTKQEWTSACNTI